MIKWITANGRARRTASGIDVRIRNGKNGRTAVVFYNGTYRMITTEGRIEIGVTDNAVYFADSKNGFHLYNHSKASDTKRVQVTSKELAAFEGDYVLQFDKVEKRYCVVRGNGKIV